MEVRGGGGKVFWGEGAYGRVCLLWICLLNFPKFAVLAQGCVGHIVYHVRASQYVMAYCCLALTVSQSF